MNVMNKLRGEDVIIVTGNPQRRRLFLMLSLPGLLVVIALWFWLTGGRTVSTENAQVNAHIVNIAPEISGRITEVFVRENQRVKPGDLLYRIDPEPYRIALLQAQANLGNATLQVAQLGSNYNSKVAEIGNKASDVELARENFARQKELLARGFTTRAQYDEARAALAAAQAQREVARADAASAHAMLGSSAPSLHPQVAAARAMAAKAALDLSRTELRAPISGIIAQADRLTPGAMGLQMLPNVSIVGGGQPWIEANFKETQLNLIRPGQTAEIEIDAIPGKTFKGHVIGIGAGTGAEFSVLPAQNATGNWVKVTQRVPVRLVLDEKPDRPIVSGWSAHVTVHVKN